MPPLVPARRPAAKSALEKPTPLGLSCEQIDQLRAQYASNQLFQNLLDHASSAYWQALRQNVQSVELFYLIVWNRIRMELVFLTEFYIKTLRDPRGFALLLRQSPQFNFWFNNTVRHTLIAKLHRFYIQVAKHYANLVTIAIYERDIEIKAREVNLVIEEFYLEQVQALLNLEWIRAWEYHERVFKAQQARRRRADILE